ncbi:MAG: bifunctional fucokinase/fucose-1-phosphate guanylyltransferase [Terrimicrobiaceae bacterium]|nr:bifunctional fucokinase/fucose-1-phosphate guanylyltransferase [Terrimicrobiaceae bacterium]
MRIERLISLPPAMAGEFGAGESPREWFAACDPPGGKLGSGGGVAHLLVSGWKARGGDFASWLAADRKLALMAGGQSRRLPAYAAEGKILMPMPALRWAAGQKLDQTLLDIQLPDYERVLSHAPKSYRMLVASGDVLLRFSQELPDLPEADVLGLGMWVDAETASQFGVFFTSREEPERLAFFLQKPTPAEIRKLAGDHLFLVDTGMWLLSERAVDVLLRKCGFDPESGEFASGAPGFYELYSDMGQALGHAAQHHDAEVAALSAAVVALPEAQFHHFGTTRQMIESTSALQNANLDQSHIEHPGVRPHPDVYVLNADFSFRTRSAQNRNVWIENCTLPPDLPMRTENVLTGFPAGDWDFALEPGACIDLVPVDESGWCVRVYGFDDAFKGAIGDAATRFLGAPAADWLARRGLNFEQAGIPPGIDLQEAQLFPVLPAPPSSKFLQWHFAANPQANPAYAARWLAAPRLSAHEIGARANLRRLHAQRHELVVKTTPKIFANRALSVFHRLDLEHAAGLYAESDAPLSAKDGVQYASAMDEVHEAMFRAAILRRRRDGAWNREEDRAFGVFREAITKSAAARPATPARRLQEDQIAWGRSPVRLDLAGGWSDTAPYCLKSGGAVVNLAVNLNGQPPVQAYVRQTDKREIVLRSIDLGAETRVRTLEELCAYDRVGDEFSLAKAAVALAGFEPRFSGFTGARTLDDTLDAFGGGIEISMLAATPKGSGLGTSSVLAATLLATLSEACGLAWDASELFQRTLVLEQLMTTGGGWQDQAGGIYRGLKMIETNPGLAQRPQLRWLPTQLFTEAAERRMMLLYYTGLRRVAKDILQEVVRGMFLNRAPQLRILAAIKHQAYRTFEAIQRNDWDALCAAVAGSWELNQRLDAGTNPPEVAGIFARVSGDLAGGKLLGAGGGGYLLMLAKDPDAAVRIRETLTSKPPNSRARFVNFEISETGMQVTRS